MPVDVVTNCWNGTPENVRRKRPRPRTGSGLDAVAELEIADVLGLRRAAAQVIEAREMHAVVARA